MKKKRIVGAIGVGMAALSMTLSPQTTHAAPANQTTVQHEAKATRTEQKTVKKQIKSNIGGSGLDIVTINNGYGLSPKEYGMRYGDGKSRKHKSNKIHVKHGYKVKKRKTA